MRGTFFCITEDARWFEAPIPAFELGQAHALH
jgi:ApaG protein